MNTFETWESTVNSNGNKKFDLFNDYLISFSKIVSTTPSTKKI